MNTLTKAKQETIYELSPTKDVTIGIMEYRITALRSVWKPAEDSAEGTTSYTMRGYRLNGYGRPEQGRTSAGYLSEGSSIGLTMQIAEEYGMEL